MRFLVYEPDPLVQADIYETLTAAFGTLVQGVADLADLPRLVGASDTKTIVVASVTSDEVYQTLNSVADILRQTPTVVVGTFTPPWFVPNEKQAFVARPFTSDGLVAAVRGVLDDPHSPRPQTP